MGRRWGRTMSMNTAAGVTQLFALLLEGLGVDHLRRSCLLIWRDRKLHTITAAHERLREPTSPIHINATRPNSLSRLLPCMQRGTSNRKIIIPTAPMRSCLGGRKTPRLPGVSPRQHRLKIVRGSEPYRCRSKLTRLLEPALTRGFVSVICTTGVAVTNFRQVADTLEFGMQAQVRIVVETSQPAVHG